jgi:WD40 repeat protein
MTTGNMKPLIFLAFANDQDDRVAYLRNLPEEAHRIQEVLERASSAGLCEVVEHRNATLKDILDVFQDSDKRNRIAIFHYAGHANGYELLLESETKQAEASQLIAANAAGLASFLGQQTGIQLVFLNGCATQQQAQGLLDAQVASVIATSRSIDDKWAMEFASRFYRGLAGGAAIQTAFNEAAAAVTTATGGVQRHLYAVQDNACDRLPWDLYVRPGAERAAHWNLPDAANEPLFGLPNLPPVQELPPQPFRHLDWFTEKEAHIFFGRGYQIRDLYQRTTDPSTSPIILFYGQSGVGKSSVLNAGLLPRLEKDYEPFYLRRDQGKSLFMTLWEALKPKTSGTHLRDAWIAHEKNGKRCVIILDQLEEVFTRPNKNQPRELEEFFEVLQEILGTPGQRPQGKLILSFRKEWLPEIERRLDERKLSRAKVFLERLNRRGIIEAVCGPARPELELLRQKYGLTVADGLPEMIANDLLEDRDSPIAPTLQILLFKMWDSARKRSESCPVFDQDLYLTLKDEGLLLQDFLGQQLSALEKRRPDMVLSGLALDVLAFHTTPLGTSEERTAKEIDKEYKNKAEAATEIVAQGKALYLLSDSQREQAGPNASCLAHDTLAPLVRKQFNQSDKPGQRALRILENRSTDWQEDRQGTPLDDADLLVVEKGEQGMRDWHPDELNLVKASREGRRRRKRKRQILLWSGIAAVIAIIVAAGLAEWQRRVAKDRAEIAFSRQLAAQSANLINKELDLSLLLSVESYKVKETTEARSSLLSALTYNTRLRTFLPGQQAGISSLLFLLDGKVLASGDHSGEIILWDVSDPHSVKPLGSKLTGHKSIINDLTYLADSKVLASADYDGEIILWDVSDPHFVKQLGSKLTGHIKSAICLTYLGDNKVLASSDDSGEIILWDVSDPHSVKPLGSKLIGHNKAVSRLSYLADSKVLASADHEGKILLWDVSDPRSVKSPIAKLTDHKRVVWDLAYLADSKVLASADHEGKILLWDVSDPRSAKPLPPEQIDSDGPISRLAYLSDSKVLASASIEGKILLWDVSDPQSAEPLESSLSGHKKAVESLAYLADSKVLASGCTDGKILLWDLSDPHSAKPLGLKMAGPERSVNCLTYLSDSKVLASGGGDGKIQLWDLSDPHSAKTLGPKLTGHEESVHCLTYLPDSKVLASGGDDGKILLWDVADPRSVKPPVSELAGPNRGVWCLTYLSDSKVLASGGGDGEILLWDVSNPRLAKPLESNLTGCKEGIMSMAYLTDSKVLASPGDDGKILLWDVSDPRSVKPPVSELFGHRHYAANLLYMADTKVLASTGDDGEILLWDVSDPRTVKPPMSKLTGHEQSVNCLTYLSDSKVLASSEGFGERIILLWDVSDPRSAKPLGSPLRGHSIHITSLSHLSDGKVLASGGSDGRILLWDLDWSSLQQRACWIANRNLTKTEWDQYMSQFYGPDNYHKTCSD